MSEANKDNPFYTLGTQLKRLREKRQETLAEVSGAVEIEPEILSTFEEGSDRPSEDILLLLISHFATKEDIATKLWELAGYSSSELPVKNGMNDSRGEAESGVIVLPDEARIVYTDMVHVMVNNYGVVMNFMQTGGQNSQPLAVARVGMSKEHAKSVLEVLQKTLNLHDDSISDQADNKKPSNKTDQSN